MLNSETSYVQAINQAISGETNRRRRKKNQIMIYINVKITKITAQTVYVVNI